MTNTLRFLWNGIKGKDGKLQKATYYRGPYVNLSTETVTILAKEYPGFSDEVRQMFTIENDSDGREDYFEHDRVRVDPSHRLYAQVLEACKSYEARWAEKLAKRTA